jgi:hypothetical protein
MLAILYALGMFLADLFKSHTNPASSGLFAGEPGNRTSNQTVIAETRVNQGSPH